MRATYTLADNGALEALRAENVRLRETLDRMEHFRSSAETALTMAEERERAAVVAWLFRLFPDNAMFSFMLNGVARQIVCGEHHCEKTRDP